MNPLNEVRPYGPRALLVRPAGGVRPADFAEAVVAGARPPAVEVVPAAETVLVVIENRDALGEVAEWLAGLLVASPEHQRRAGADDVVVDVTYDGPDLAPVAAAAGLSISEVIARHSGGVYVCDFCGFAPGFAYLSGLDPSLVLPRRPTPRTSVPAGSVAIAGPYSAVYPTSSPGGWHLLGRTDAVLFDPAAALPALITPGTGVRFRPVPRSGRRASRPAGRSTTRTAGGTEDNQMGERRWALRVESAGFWTSFQDGGRPGHAVLGVPASGALDPARRDLVNRLVGNPADRAVLETAGDLVLAAVESAVVADSVTGAVRSLAVGDTVAVDPPAGLWAYVAVRGGFAVESTLGSRSSDTLSGIGPDRPVAGAVLPVGPDPGTPITADQAPVGVPPPARRLRVWPGPHLDWFDDGAFAQLAATTWTCTTDTSRIGRRLQGPALTRHPDAGGRELLSAGLVIGAIQVATDGQLVVMFADHPTTGGYPVIGVVDDRDLPALMHAAPSTVVTFRI